MVLLGLAFPVHSADLLATNGWLTYSEDFDKMTYRFLWPKIPHMESARSARDSLEVSIVLASQQEEIGIETTEPPLAGWY